MNRYLIRSDHATGYSPANHTGTTNRRIISRESTGSRFLEILIGSIQKGQGALTHAHPQLEQLGFVLEGRGRSEVNGQPTELGPGAWSYVPRGTFHNFTVTSEEPARLIVVYAPPYGEDPSLSLVAPEVATAQSLSSSRHVIPMPAFDLGRTTQVPIITRETVGAEKVEVHLINLHKDEPMAVRSDARSEHALYVLCGAVSVQHEDEDFCANGEDWVYLPPSHRMFLAHAGKEDQRCSAFLIRGSAP